MTKDELKIRQMTNQHLLRGTDKMTVVHDLCGIQSQFFPNALHSLKIRCRNFDESTFASGLVKNWTIRGTVNIFSEDDLPLFLGAQTYRSDDWTIPSFWNQREDWALTPARQKELSELILSALQCGSRSRDELKDLCRADGMSKAEESSMFHPWGGGIRELCERGFMHALAQEEKAYCLTPLFDPMPEDAAKLELARRYFAHIAPATIHDAMYFFRTTAAQVKKWLDQLPVTSIECEGKTYFYIENGSQYSTDMPRCLFLAGFDQLLLGYEKKESLYLPQEHLRKIFNLAGIVMPSLLLDGQIIGRWKRKSNKLTVELFVPISMRDKNEIERTAQVLWGEATKIDFKE